jgi:hypothetical protein
MVNVGIFYDHLEYFMASWYNFWPFGTVCGHLLYFSQFGMFGPRKIWQPCLVTDMDEFLVKQFFSFEFMHNLCQATCVHK